MSSYGNTCWTKDREQLAERLIQASRDCDDDTFYDTMDGITSIHTMKAVAALAIENLTQEEDTPPECVQCARQLVVQAVEDLQRLLHNEIQAASEAAYTSIGKRIDLDSHIQLERVLFEELGMSKCFGSDDTRESALRWMFQRTGHPFLSSVLAYRDASRRKASLDGLLTTLLRDVIKP